MFEAILVEFLLNLQHLTTFFVLEVVLPLIISLKYFEERELEPFSIEIHIYGYCLMKPVHVKWLFQQGNVLGDFRYLYDLK